MSLHEELLTGAEKNTDASYAETEDGVAHATKRRTIISIPDDSDFEADDLQNCKQAGIYLRMSDTFVPFDHVPIRKSEINTYLFVHSSRYCWLELFFALLLLSLALVEYPAVFPGFPWQITSTVDVLCLCFFVVNLYYRGIGIGAQVNLKTHPTFCLRIAVIFLLLINMGLTAAYPNKARFLRVFRVVLILDPEYAEGVRRVCRQTMITTLEIFDMLVLLVLYILLFSVLGFYFFSENETDPYFETLGTSFVSLFILMTTANYPDVMMPAYQANNFSCLFFIAYMMFGFYLLTNIVLSMVYDSFTDTEKRKFKKEFFHKREGIRLAWQTAMGLEKSIDFDPDDEEIAMGFASFYRVCKSYRDTLTDKHIYLAYRSLDNDLNGTINFSEFQNIFEVLDVSYHLVWNENTDENELFWWSGWDVSAKMNMIKLKDIVEHPYFEYTIDLVILANTMYVVIRAAQESPHQNSANDGSRTGNIEWLFFSIYASEMITKMFALGYRTYLSRVWNRFDCFVVVSSAIGIIIQESSSSKKSAQITVFIRSLRLLRLVKVRASFREVIAGMAYLIPKTGRFVCALLAFFYVFAIVGMGLFNDTVSRCSPFSGIACFDVPRCCSNATSVIECAADADAVCGADPYGGVCANDPRYQCAPTGLNCGSEYAQLPPAYAPVGRPHSNVAGYYQLNSFNNILLAYVLLFEQMIVNNWFVAMNGHVYMTGEWARIYFMVFFLFAVQVVTNVIVAFIIDSFMTVFPLLKTKGTDASGKGWNRTYREHVEISISEAQETFPSDDLEILLPVQTLKYKASAALRGADIDRILFGDDIEEWLKQEKDPNANEEQSGVEQDSALAPAMLIPETSSRERVTSISRRSKTADQRRHAALSHVEGNSHPSTESNA